MKLAVRTILTILLIAIILLNLFTHVFAVVRFYGDGMEPTLENHQILVVLRTEEAKPGDMVAFYFNNKALVRRVIAEDGQQITVNEDGSVLVDNNPLAEPYVKKLSFGQCNLEFPYTVPLDQYFVMGDNRETSMDSRLREIGTVTKERLIGKVILSF